MTLPFLIDATASITYSPSAALTDLGFVDAYHAVDDLVFVPVEKVAQPAATRTIELEVIFDTMDDGTNHGTFNYVVYNPQPVPAILSALTLGANATIAEAYGPATFVLDGTDVVDIVVKNGDAGKHPL